MSGSHDHIVRLTVFRGRWVQIRTCDLQLTRVTRQRLIAGSSAVTAGIPIRR